MKWPKELAIVHVEWEDTVACPGWHDRHEIEDFVEENDGVMTSLGFLVEDNPRVVVIAQSSGVQHLGELLKIPKVNIRRMYQINSPTDKRKRKKKQ